MRPSPYELSFEPVIVSTPPAGRAVVRWAVLVALFLSPLAMACQYPWGYGPLLAVCFGAGAYSLHQEYRRERGTPPAEVPGERWLLVLLAIVILQLIPMPPALLSLVSPGSHSFYSEGRVPLQTWKPITVSPADTLRGLLFLAGFSLLYRVVVRELDHPVWRRRLVLSVVGAGLALTIEALLQEAYSPGVIYGFYHPRGNRAAFGPYGHRDHFAAYMVMAAALGLGLCAEALEGLRHAWRRRRRRAWLALGDPEGITFLRSTTVAIVPLAGLLATRSRGGLLALCVAAAMAGWVWRQRHTRMRAMLIVIALAVGWIAVQSATSDDFNRGLWNSRRETWMESAKLIPRHPFLGSGLNAFGRAYRSRRDGGLDTARNEYLQIVIDVGLLGTIPAVALLGTLLSRARNAARKGALEVGVFASLVALMIHNMIDSNWQVAANAATFAALAGLAAQGSQRTVAQRQA